MVSVRERISRTVIRQGLFCGATVGLPVIYNHVILFITRDLIIILPIFLKLDS